MRRATCSPRPLPADRFETWFIVHRRHDARMLRDRLREALLELPDVDQRLSIDRRRQ